MRDKIGLDELLEAEASLDRVDLSSYDEKTKESLLDDIMMEFGKEPFSKKKTAKKTAQSFAGARVGVFMHPAERKEPVPRPGTAGPCAPNADGPAPAAGTSVPQTPQTGRPETPLQLEYAPQAPTFRELEPGPASAPQLSDADDLDTFERIYRSKKEREEESFKLQKDTLYNTWSREFDRTSDNVRRAFKTDTIIFSSSTEERDIWGRVIDRDDKKQSELKDETYEIYGGTPKKEPLADTDDEEHWQDPGDIRAFLMSQKRALAVKTVLAFILSIAAAALTLTPRLGLPLPKALTDPAGFVYAAVHLFLALAAFLLYLRYTGNVIGGIFRFRFYNDTLPTLALWASIAYNFCMASGLVEAGPNTSYYTVVPVSVIAFSLLGKLLFVKNVVQNFELAVSSGEKHAGTLIKTSHMPVRFFGGDRKACSIRCVDSITGFFEKSFSDDPSEKASQITTPIAMLICAAAAAAAVFYGRGGELFSIVVLGLALSAPLFSELSFSLPFYVLSRYSRKNGGAIIGYRAVRHHEDVDMVVAPDKALFPPDKAVVQSMRVTSKSAIDEVLIAAASLICAMGGPLKDAFMAIVDNKPELLKPVESYECVDNQGVTGIIDNRRYYLGTLAFIRSSGAEISQKMLEAASSTKAPAMLLANDASAIAVFFTDYGVDNDTASTLRRFCSDDTSLVVITDDSNITEELVKERFSLSKTDVLLPFAEEKRMYRESVLPLKSASAGILSVNGAAGVVAALNIARRVRDVVNTCLLLRAAGVFISLMFLLYFTVTGSSINVWQALAMQFLWAVPSVLSIFARKLG